MSAYGLVLGGGGARGAYQVGVLRYVLSDLARKLGRPTWPEVVSGTSVGAHNAIFAAARSAGAVDRLARLWRDLEVEQVYTFRWANGIALIRATLGASDPFALLDATPLHELARTRFPRGFLRRSIDSGACRALILSATDVDTGYNVLFIDTADPDFDFVPAPATTLRRVRIDHRHVLASGAIPVLFAPIPLGGRLYVDGGLRQNTPLRPLLRSGSSRVLVVGVTQGRSAEAEMAGKVVPNLPFLLGKTFNALMLDPVERDIQHAEQLNEILRWGALRFGEAFADEALLELGRQPVDILYLTPREDLGRVATEVYRNHPPRASAATRWLLHRIADTGHNVESDLLSYLFFDKAYTGLLERLGWEDARDREQEIVDALFAD